MFIADIVRNDAAILVAVGRYMCYLLFCHSEGWMANGRELVVQPSECAASLTYTVNLVTAGTVTFAYQFEEARVSFIFNVRISNLLF